MELEKDNVANLLTTFIAIILISMLIYFIHLVYHPVSIILNILELFHPDLLPAFAPEPVEKMQYIASLIALPFIIFASHLFIKRLNIQTAYLYNTLFIILAFFVLLFSIIGLKNEKYFYFWGFILRDYKAIGVLSGVILLSLYYYIKDSKQTLISISIILTSSYISLYIAYLNVFSLKSIDNTGIYAEHFNAVYYSVAAVMYKHSLFVNLDNQYGLYPELLRPLFQVIGLSVHKFTFVMCILIAITFLSWFYMLYRSLEQKWIAFVGFMTMIYFSYLFIHGMNFDSYFQYYPIRTIFPSLLLVVAITYLKSNKKIYYYIGWIIFPIGMMWNADTGIVTFITWTVFLLYKECIEINETLLKRLLKHILIGAVYTISIFALYSLYILLKSGHLINYVSMMEYIKIFYSYGFYMLPMPTIHPWNLVILVYVVGLVISIKSLIERKYSIQNHMIFMISILGCGLFSYYQGRSHNVVLCYAYYPAFLLLAIYTEKLIRSTIKIHVISGYVMLFILSASTTTAFIAIPANSKLYGNRLNQVSSSERTSSVKQVEFIQKHTKREDVITILSFNSGAYYGETKTTPELNLAGTSEMLLKKDYDKLQSEIKNKTLRYIFLDVNYLETFKSINEVTVKLVKENYIPIDESEDKQMVLYQKK